MLQWRWRRRRRRHFADRRKGSIIFRWLIPCPYPVPIAFLGKLSLIFHFSSSSLESEVIGSKECEGAHKASIQFGYASSEVVLKMFFGGVLLCAITSLPMCDCSKQRREPTMTTKCRQNRYELTWERRKRLSGARTRE